MGFAEYAAEIAVRVWDWLMTNLLPVNLVLSIVIVFFRRRDPRAVWTWLLALYFIPVFGFLLYLFLEQDYRKSKMFRIKEAEDRVRFPAKNQEEWIRERERGLSGTLAGEYSGVILYNLETSGSVLTMKNRVEIFTDGEEKFADLRRELSQARHYIHIQYYIIKNDEVFASLVPILKEKAAEGVEVRILCDGMGGRFIPSSLWRRLEEAGIRVAIFFPPVLGRLNLRINYRNHRKIVVIDGRVGYVGGFNIGREYLSKDPRFGYWRDTHLKISGEAVMGLQIRFAQDWNYAAGENLFQYGRYFREKTEDSGPETDWVGVQIISSGPDTQTRQIRDTYLALICRARRHIYIQTPYFVPDDAVLSALQIAARSGVEVRLMVPCKPDHPFVYWATYSYVGDLLRAGARCYAYEAGFLHAKGITVDGCVSCYGTANMDIRSFQLNFEVNAILYDEETTARLEESFLRDLAHCREITEREYAGRNVIVRFREQCCRLLSPLL